VAVPSGYTDVLRDAMSGHEVPLEMEHAFVEYAAWRDLRVAELSASGWDGEGYLVIVAERGQVQGGKGISWQAEEVVEAPVHAVVLAPGACADGDRVWFPRALGWLGAEPEPPAR